MTESVVIPGFVHDELDRLELSVTAGQLSMLARYLGLLLDENTRMNLTAIREPESAWRRLIIDSLTVLPWLEIFPAGAKVIDIGTGGGLPGIPLGICRPDLQMVLLDSTGKKVVFLERCIEQMDLSHITAINSRAELLGHEKCHRDGYDVAVSRAIGSMSIVLEYSLPLVRPGGRMLAMKGPKAEQELSAAADAMDLLGAGEISVYDAYPESFDNELVIISIMKDRPTPKAYPRSPGLPQQSPL